MTSAARVLLVCVAVVVAFALGAVLGSSGTSSIAGLRSIELNDTEDDGDGKRSPTGDDRRGDRSRRERDGVDPQQAARRDDDEGEEEDGGGESDDRRKGLAGTSVGAASLDRSGAGSLDRSGQGD